jgi:hypothetical protein
LAGRPLFSTILLVRYPGIHLLLMLCFGFQSHLVGVFRVVNGCPSSMDDFHLCSDAIRQVLNIFLLLPDLTIVCSKMAITRSHGSVIIRHVYHNTVMPTSVQSTNLVTSLWLRD